MRLLPIALTAVSLAALPAAPALAAPGGSLVFIRDGNVWIAQGDGTGARAVTRDGGYAFPSQADDGTIVAQRGSAFVRLSQAGAPLGSPIESVLGDSPLPGFAGPYWPRVSPDGSTIAYAYAYTE